MRGHGFSFWGIARVRRTALFPFLFTLPTLLAFNAQAVNREPALEKPFPWPVAYADESPPSPHPPRVGPDLPRFREVSSGLLRGGRPSQAGLERLARLGVKTLVNLEAVLEFVEQERAAAALLGMKMVSYPMLWEEYPSDAQVTAVLAELKRGTAEAPVYVHCFHGKDRTGLVVALHRVLEQGWEPGAAYSEMLGLGFYSKYEELKRYYWWKVGEPGAGE